MARVLFVGADKSLADMMKKLLQRNGFNAVYAVGIDEAKKALRTNSIDVVVADLETDVPQSVRFCRELKTFHAKTKLLMVSENSDDEIPILNAGADDWMKKPYRMRVLYARIGVLLKLKGG